MPLTTDQENLMARTRVFDHFNQMHMAVDPNGREVFCTFAGQPAMTNAGHRQFCGATDHEEVATAPEAAMADKSADQLINEWINGCECDLRANRGYHSAECEARFDAAGDAALAMAMNNDRAHQYRNWLVEHDGYLGEGDRNAFEHPEPIGPEYVAGQVSETSNDYVDQWRVVYYKGRQVSGMAVEPTETEARKHANSVILIPGESISVFSPGTPHPTTLPPA